MRSYNVLSSTIDEFIHGDNIGIIAEKVSLSELKVILKFFLKTYGGITGEELVTIYKSQNKEYVTNIPLIKQFLKDYDTEIDKELFIKSLLD